MIRRNQLLTWAALLLMWLPLVTAILNAIPATADGPLHVYRVVALREAWRVGDLWPRFSPELFYGYGAALFNYYPPLYLFPATLLNLFGLNAQVSLWGSLSGYALVGLVGAYTLGSTAWERPAAGLLSAAALLYAPYILVNLLWRGAAAEFAALMLYPWVLWGFYRLARHPNRRTFLLAVGCFALFIPMHNITTLFGTAMLAVFCAVWAIRHEVWLPLAGAGALALGVTAFVWGPALFELEYVRVGAAGTNTAIEEGFRTLGEIVALPRTADPTQLRASVPLALGWVQIGAAVVGLVFALQTRERVALGVTAAVLTLLAVFFVLPASAPLWEELPLIDYAGFPWRFLGLASMSVALLAGGMMWQPRYTVPAVLAMMLLYAMPWLYPAPEQPPRFAFDADGVRSFEAKTGWLMTMSYGEFIPQGVEELPPTGGIPLVATRFDKSPRLLSAEPAVINAEWQRKSADLRFGSGEGGRIVLAWSAFPGWQAEADGERIPVGATEGQGLLTVEVPAETERLHLWYAGTPLQHAMTTLSAIAVGIGGFAAWRLPAAPADARSSTGQQSLVPVLVVLIGVLLIKLLLIDPGLTPIQRSRLAEGRIPDAVMSVEATYGGQVRLLGADVPRQAIASGDTIAITTLWRAEEQPPAEDHRVFVRLVNGSGFVIAEVSNPVGVPASDWRPDLYVAENVSLTVPAYTPPGEYTMRVAVFSPGAGRDLNAVSSAGQPLGVSVDLGMLLVERPNSQRAWSGSAVPLTDEMAFLSLEPNLPAQAEVGQPLTFSWLWQAGTQPESNYTVRLVWRAVEGVNAASTDELPPVSDYSTQRWQLGDIWRGWHTVYVPGDLAAGTYSVWVELSSGEGHQLGTMRVTTPPRTFSMPPVGSASGAEWQPGIVLEGYTVQPGVMSIELKLVWRTMQPLHTDYRVFVHLVDEAGNILTQRDTRPVDGARPTPGWAPGEFISGVHTLPNAEGAYALRIGLYNPLTGQRPQLRGGGEWVEIMLENRP